MWKELLELLIWLAKMTFSLGFFTRKGRPIIQDTKERYGCSCPTDNGLCFKRLENKGRFQSACEVLASVHDMDSCRRGLQALEEIISMEPSPRIQKYCYMVIGDHYIRRKKFEAALRPLESARELTPQAPLLDKMMLKVGWGLAKGTA